MTQTRITVTDEMVQRYMAGASPLAAALGWGTEPTEDRKRIIRTGLEAALGPLLERRKGNRRGSELNHVNRRLGLTDDGWDGLGPGGS